MEQRPNQQDHGIFPDRCGAAGCAHVNAVYGRVQSGSKINAVGSGRVGSDSGLISSGLSRVGFIFFFYYLCTSGSGKKWFGSIRVGHGF